MVERLALRIAYDGTKFHGSQRQPEERTVEGDLSAALCKIGAVQDSEFASLQMASRTDAGVSAAANIVAFDTGFDPEKLASALNGTTRDIWCWGIARVPAGFRPRRAHRRRYRYLLPVAGLDDRRLSKTLSLFVGEHDFSSFCRLEEGDDPRHAIDAITIHDRGALAAIDLEARYFLWNEVRRIVEASRRVAAGELDSKEVERALAGERADLGVAPAENLVLLHVDAGVPFAIDGNARSRVLLELGSRLFSYALRREVLATLAEAMEPE